MRKQLLACAVLAAAMIPSLAEAALVSIAVAEDGGALSPNLCPVTNNCQLTALATGNFVSNIGGISQPGGNTTLMLTATDISVSAGLGTPPGAFLDVYVTASNLLAPIANPLDVLSGLTQNLITPGWSSTLTTFISENNDLFNLGTQHQLDTATFTAIGSQSLTNALFGTGPGPFSVTGHFHIVSDGTAGGSNATIVMVPGPIVGAGLPGLIAACLGLIGLARRRRKQLAA